MGKGKTVAPAVAVSKWRVPATAKKQFSTKKTATPAKKLREGQTKQSVADEVKRLMQADNLSERAAIARITDLPYSTVKGWLANVPNNRSGPEPALGHAYERRLVELVLYALDNGYPVTTTTLRAWVCSF